MIRIAMLTAALVAAAAVPALAQDLPPPDVAQQDVPQQAPAAGETPAPDLIPLTPEESAALAAALQDDSTAAPRAGKPLKIPGHSGASHFGVTRSTQPYGAETYTFKRALPSLNAKIGADLGTGATPTPYYEPDRPITAAAGNSGAAWASVDVSGSASIDARVDPTADQGRLATTFKHSVPFGSNYSLTMQNSSGVTNTIGAPAANAAPGLPMMALPQAGNTGATQVWDDQPSMKFDVKSTGTSISAGFARSSADPVVHNRIGAEQKLYGPLHLNTAVSDLGEATENRSIGATIKFGW